MSSATDQSTREFREWNEQMAREMNPERYYAHPSLLVRIAMNQRLRLLTRLLSCRGEGMVLDVGCGPGHLLAELTGRSRVGLELSNFLLERARQRLGSAGCWLVCGDACRLPFATASIPQLVCTEVLEHVLDPEQAIAEMARVLSPGGHAIITAPNEPAINAVKSLTRKLGLYDRLLPTVPWRATEAWHKHEFTPAAVRELLSRHLRVLRVRRLPSAIVPLTYVFECDRPA